MFRSLKFAVALLLGCALPAEAAQTNYLGTIFVADPTILTRQLTVNADGSINVTPAPSTTAPPPYVYTYVATAQYNLTAVAATTLTVPVGALYGFGSVDSNATCNQAVQYTDDGATTPTATVGKNAPPNTTFFYTRVQLLNFKFIQQASCATMSWDYWR